MTKFQLSDQFISQFIGKQPKWGPIGYVTYKRTYARDLDRIFPRHRELGERAGLTNEEFWLTLTRVTEGTFTILKDHCHSLRLPWSEIIGQRKAQEFFLGMWEFRWTPPGRGLWTMGAPIVDKVGGACLANCGFQSTQNIDVDFAEPFCSLMDFSMLGVGVGFDTRGVGKVRIQTPILGTDTHVVSDDREGWVELLRRTLNAFVGVGALPGRVDVSQVRPSGSPILGFGGTASGPKALLELYESIGKLLYARVGQLITSSIITDIGNMIGRCVVAGGARRSAEIVFGDPDDEPFMDLKDKTLHPLAVDGWRWASNNSILAKVGQSYDRVAKRITKNGEPGLLWLENAQRYGRMGDPPNDKDARAMGANPCQPAWATVLTPGGISTIGKIREGDLIWSGARWTSVVKKWSTGVKQVHGYYTRAGVFFGTAQHKVISHGERVEVQHAKTIDKCVGSVDLGHKKPFDHQVVTDGLVLGDGMFHRACDRVFLCAGIDEVDEYWQELGNLVGDYRPGVGTHTYNVKTNYVHLPLTFDRQIPEDVLFGTSDYQCSFLRGLYTANGSVVENRVTLKAASFDVIHDVQQILSAIGISSYYTVNKPSTIQHKNGEYTSRQSYDLNIGTLSGRKIFAERIGFIQKHKTERLAETLRVMLPSRDPKVSFEVAEVEDISEEEVFDITVDDPDHTYWTGGLLVANCNEQTLFDKELCVLVETYPFNHDDVKQYLRTLKFAYLYAKAVTLVPTHNPATNAVMMMNRRIGCSMSGTTQAMQKFGRRAFFDLCDRGYEYIQALDEEYSEWLCVPRSIKTTSVKPGGTTPLLAGILAGMSYPISEYYWRVIRFATNSPMLPALRSAGYQTVEIDQAKEPNTTAVYFPVKIEGYERGERDVSMWEQLEIAAALQAHWADNQVSVTVKFDRETEGPQIARALEFMETRLKGVSFLPHDDHGYEHAPYQAITREEYEDAVKTLRPLDLTTGTHEVTDAFCDGDKCVVPMPSQSEIKDAFDVLLIAKQRADAEIAALRAHDGPSFLERHARTTP